MAGPKRARWLRYWTTIAKALRENPPKGKRVMISVNVTAKAKDVTAKVGKDGSFSFTAPRDIEAPKWNETLEAPFIKAAKGK